MTSRDRLLRHRVPHDRPDEVVCTGDDRDPNEQLYDRMHPGHAPSRTGRRLGWVITIVFVDRFRATPFHSRELRFFLSGALAVGVELKRHPRARVAVRTGNPEFHDE